jgi:hypothetical protein
VIEQPVGGLWPVEHSAALAQLLRKALLTPTEHEALHLRYNRNATQREIAGVFGKVSPTRVGQLLRSAIGKLRYAAEITETPPPKPRRHWDETLTTRRRDAPVRVAVQAWFPLTKGRTLVVYTNGIWQRQDATGFVGKAGWVSKPDDFGRRISFGCAKLLRRGVCLS